MIQSLIQAIDNKSKQYFSNLKNSNNYYANQEQFIKFIKQNDVCYKVMYLFCELTSYMPRNVYMQIAEINQINEKCVIVNRNIYSERKSRKKYRPLGGDAINSIFENILLHVNKIDDVTLIRKRIANDFLFLKEELPDDSIIEYADFKIVRAKCTEMGGVYITSKRAQRYFLLYEGIIYLEKTLTPICYNVIKNPPINNIEDILILVSYQSLKGHSGYPMPILDELRPLYGDAVTKKLLKID